MHTKTLGFIIVAAIGGFIGGFWLANSINRSAQNSIGAVKPATAGPSPSSQSSPGSSGEPDLSTEEIQSKIAEADKNPGNFDYQKDLGLALYRYATIKKDNSLLLESERILERASTLNAKDFDVMVGFGNARFDLGFSKRDAVRFQGAREIYSRALAIKPGDADVQTDLGLTYMFQEPPAYDKAESELQKVITANPGHTRSLQFLIQAYIKQNKIADAEKAIAKLKSMDPNNQAIAELMSQINAATSGSTK